MSTSKFWAEPGIEIKRLQDARRSGEPLALRVWEEPDALQNIRDRIVYLDAQDDGELDRKELLYFLSKPWKWEPEYLAMRAAETSDV